MKLSHEFRLLGPNGEWVVSAGTGTKPARLELTWI